MGNIFFEITLVLIIASFFSIVFKFLRQPPILAYILTGIAIGPFGGLQLEGKEFLQLMGELGITFLLFMIGLELRFSDLKSVGKAALSAGVLQVALTTLGGFVLATLLGFSQTNSLFIGVALAFSSTIIVVKLLSDQKDLQSLFGKISIGLLLVQDLFAIFILIFLSSFSSGVSYLSIISVLLKGIIIFSLIILLSNKIFPRILDKISSSSETLFLFSIAWALALSAFVASNFIGFSIEIGGLLAGLALANTQENFQIIGKTKSLRDFFVIIFFVFLGMSMDFSSFANTLIPALALSLFVLLIKPLIIMPILGFYGYRRRTSFLTGIYLSQVSEFSLIIVLLGSKVGQIPNEIVSLITTVAIITFALSTYSILGKRNLYEAIGSKLSIFEKKMPHEEKIEEKVAAKDHVILVGANRTGGSILKALISQGENVTVIDFNPDVIKSLKTLRLRSGQINSLFGDISDLEIQERAGLKDAKLVISTVSDLEDNMILISEISAKGRSSSGRKKPKLIVMANDDKEEKELYKAGANYVIQPHVLGGRHLAHLIKTDSLFRS